MTTVTDLNTYTPTTTVQAIDLFVEDDCHPTARDIGDSERYVVRIGPVTLFGTPETLERVLAEATEALSIATDALRPLRPVVSA